MDKQIQTRTSRLAIVLSVSRLALVLSGAWVAQSATFYYDVGQVPHSFWTSTSLKGEPPTAVAGSEITLTSKTDGVNWSGVSISFYLDGSLIGTAPTDTNSQAQLKYRLGSLSVGQHTLQAIFPATSRSGREVLSSNYVETIYTDPFGNVTKVADTYITTGTVVDTARSSSGTAPLTVPGAAPGWVDLSFDPGSGADDAVATLALQADGKVLIGGSFTRVDGTTRNGVARLNSDGRLDTSFDPGSGVDYYVGTLTVQSDGKVVIGGGFTKVNGTARNCVARLNADGSLDTSFDPGPGTELLVDSLAVQGDGKVVIGGSFISVNGTARNHVTRLNADGSLDTSFDSASLEPIFVDASRVYSLAVQSDGRIVIGGRFSGVNGTSRNGVARLNADGSPELLT